MSELRATKSGFAREAQQKLEAGYDKAEAKQCMDWIGDVLGERFDTDGSARSVEGLLKDGIVLLRLYKAIDPNCRKFDLDKEKNKQGAFQQMERIGKFATLIKGPPLNIKEHCAFATVDLFEGGNMLQVITCLKTVGGACHSDHIPVKGFGVKETQGNKREFTEEQLAQGKSVIGLQMGSNKGASQAGQNFGKARHIVD